MNKNPIPVEEEMAIILRAFISPALTKDEAKALLSKRKPSRKNSKRASDWCLIFDTETTIDAYQNLRFGTYQLRKSGELMEAGIFYNPEIMSAFETKLLSTYAATCDLHCMTVRHFLEKVFIKKAYEYRASIIGFNLPFDISRIAEKQAPARGKTMNGGFSFHALDNSYAPYIRVKHLNSRASLMQFAQSKQPTETRSQQRKKLANPVHRGNFVDLKTIAAALHSRSFSLGSLADFLKTETRKAVTDEHGGRLTKAYIDYAMQDVQVTWECYVELHKQYVQHGLSKTPIGKILSEASIGKAYLKEMGIRPFLEMQPDFPRHLLGHIMTSYYGGRSEVRIRREVRQVLYCDFLSMYPTVCTLMHLWQFVTAKGIDWRETSEQTQTFIDAATIEDFQNPEIWSRLHTIVALKPEADILPVRARYNETSHNIGLNYLTSESGLWYTLADVMTAKFLTGKAPVIEKAVTFYPREMQDNLQPILISGKANYRVSPSEDDFYKRLIDLRTNVKQDMLKASGHKLDTLSSAQLALKLLANSTSYGIFVELNAVRDDKSAWNVFTTEDESFALERRAKDKVEEPGPFFNPILATLITGAARLMLTLAETRVDALGLDWAFCDTDSMAIAKPANMNSEEFFSRAQKVCDWFDALNPYEKPGPIFKIEDANFAVGGKALEPLFCFCISSKRYVLFNYDDDDGIIIRKASAHGLGHLLAPYGETDAPTSIKPPVISLKEIGVDRWQYDLWMKILEAAHSDHPERVNLTYHSALTNPAVSRYSATSPQLHRWFKIFNLEKPYSKQVKPFNFLLTFMAKKSDDGLLGKSFEKPKRGRPKKERKISPVAPFSRNVSEAIKTIFDRETGEPIHSSQLQTYIDQIAQYHMHPEMKFRNGDYFDRGTTERRHIRAIDQTYIGKESNQFEEQYFTGPTESALLEIRKGNFQAIQDRLDELREEQSERALARQWGLSRPTLAKVRKKGLGVLSPAARNKVQEALRKYGGVLPLR